MNPSFGYQVYQAERTPNRADMLATQAQAGVLAAAAMRTVRGMARVLSGR